MQMGYLSKGVLVLAVAVSACDAPAPDQQTPAQQVERGEAEGGAGEYPVMGPERHILAFGDSLFAGYGLAPEQSYPARLESALRARGINARMTNAGVSGDTTAAGLQRLEFTLSAQKQKPDLFILELGGNDLLRGLNPAQTRSNLSAMLATLRQKDIPVLLMGMRAPPNYGAEYQAQFDGMYPALAKQYGATLYPFFLEAIYDQPALFQQDRIHPTIAGVEALVGATRDIVSTALPKPSGKDDGGANSSGQ